MPSRTVCLILQRNAIVCFKIPTLSSGEHKDVHKDIGASREMLSCYSQALSNFHMTKLEKKP